MADIAMIASSIRHSPVLCLHKGQHCQAGLVLVNGANSQVEVP